MARLRLICLTFCMVLAIYAQRQMTIPQLQTFIKSAVSMKNDDRQVADAVRKLKLTNRLDARTVEELQGLGAGPRTMAALRELITATASLPAAEPVTGAAVVTIPPPDAAEQKKVLAEATQNALDYTKNLPNFICTQVTRRSVAPTGSQAWRPVDRIQEQLSYLDGKENYKVVMVNDRPVTEVSHTQLGGTTSSGEFGTMLSEIFSPETHTEFEWYRWGTLRSRRMHVYTFRVRQENSKYSIHDGESGRTIVAGYHGLIYVDRDTNVVTKIQMDCEGLEGFPVSQVGLEMDYNFTKIGDNEYMLPLKAEVRSRAGRFLNKNEVEFRLYRKFGAEATIIFDTPDPIPADQLKEQPATR